jgi:hypothetical protein
MDDDAADTLVVMAESIEDAMGQCFVVGHKQLNGPQTAVLGMFEKLGERMRGTPAVKTKLHRLTAEIVELCQYRSEVMSGVLVHINDGIGDGLRPLPGQIKIGKEGRIIAPKTVFLLGQKGEILVNDVVVCVVVHRFDLRDRLVLMQCENLIQSIWDEGKRVALYIADDTAASALDRAAAGEEPKIRLRCFYGRVLLDAAGCVGGLGGSGGRRRGSAKALGNGFVEGFTDVAL